MGSGTSSVAPLRPSGHPEEGPGGTAPNRAKGHTDDPESQRGTHRSDRVSLLILEPSLRRKRPTCGQVTGNLRRDGEMEDSSGVTVENGHF